MISFDREIWNVSDLELQVLARGYKYTVYAGVAVVIEGHKGVITLSRTEIVVSLGKSSLTVVGDSLTIKQMTSSYLAISGKLSGVTLA